MALMPFTNGIAGLLFITAIYDLQTISRIQIVDVRMRFLIDFAPRKILTTFAFFFGGGGGVVVATAVPSPVTFSQSFGMHTISDACGYVFAPYFHQKTSIPFLFPLKENFFDKIH